MLPVVFLQLFAAGGAFAAAVNFRTQEPFALFGEHDGDDGRPHLPPFPLPHPKPPPPPPGKTVYDVLHGDERFSKLNKAIEFVGDDIIGILNDTDRQLTFFAVPDVALHPPHRRHGHDDDDDDDKKHKKHKHKKGKHGKKHRKHKKDDYLFDIALANASPTDAALKALLLDKSLGLAGALEMIDEFDEVTQELCTCMQDDVSAADDDGDDSDGDDDDDEKERRKRIFKFIVKSILEYHILPHGAYDIDGLGHNTTYETQFHVPSLLGNHGQRVKVSQRFKKLQPRTWINFFSKVTDSAKTDNGIIHVVRHPLLPPASIFQELFLAQHFFSTLTSAIQRTGLTDELDVRYVKDEGHGHLEGSTAATVFAPSNKAFSHLPRRLQIFLFSPFGTRVLRKLLEYHIVPGVVAHADVIHNQTAETNPGDVRYQSPSCPTTDTWNSVFDLPRPEPFRSVNATLKTRLVNHTVDWTAEKFKFTIPIPKHKKEVYETKVFVNHQHVLVPDIVALNGAIHAIDHLLIPCHHRNETVDENIEAPVDPWENWENWLPQWAASND
ncbi:FAS1 domain-containing protein [Coprinopsis marcescibilis]|uniref:FAS1 domain-containing protein n=1 Tax=Coprinopsis marcescibilis TaxID=230819 RepID=A0A5C3KXG3_COPMA|nr:FAS1 domain-containing protein [Coprinopsis marcescibilis]